MFVVEVCTLRAPSALSVSAGSPLCSSVIATKDAQVPSAQRCSGSGEGSTAACAAGTSASSATSPAKSTIR